MFSWLPGQQTQHVSDDTLSGWWHLVIQGIRTLQTYGCVQIPFIRLFVYSQIIWGQKTIFSTIYCRAEFNVIVLINVMPISILIIMKICERLRALPPLHLRNWINAQMNYGGRLMATRRDWNRALSHRSKMLYEAIRRILNIGLSWFGSPGVVIKVSCRRSAVDHRGMLRLHATASNLRYAYWLLTDRKFQNWVTVAEWLICSNMMWLRSSFVE